MTWNKIGDDGREFDDLPDDTREVIYATRCGQVNMGWFDWDDDETGYVWRDVDGDEIKATVTYWMEIPEHPET